MTRRTPARSPRTAAAGGFAALTAATLVLGLLSPAASAAEQAQAPSPGAAGIGDPLYPGLGNGGYDVLHYDLDLRWATSRPSQPMQGDETIAARATQSLSRFNLDFAGRGITKVYVNGHTARFTRQGQEVVITPAKPIAKGSVFVIGVKGFSATPTIPGELTPSDALVYNQDGQATAGQPDGEHYVFPNNDHPRDKASYTIRIDAPNVLTAVASGQLARKHTSGTRTQWLYVMKQPMATELIQLAVGRYTVVNRKPVDGVKLRDVIPTRLLKRYKNDLGIVREQMAWMVDRAGAYPFATYGSLMNDAGLGFALETQTLSIFDTASWDGPKGAWASTMTHELAHQWFGDDVAPYSWTDIWLNEGHATWYEVTYGAEKKYLADDYSDIGTNDLTAFFKAVYAAGDQYRADHGAVAKIRDNSLDEQFNPNVYEGGALVLFALRQRVGKATFAKIERAWVTRYSGKSASTDDFIALASKVSGRDLTSFLGAWVYSEKTPPMPGHPDWTVDPAGSSAATASAKAAAKPGAARHR